MDNFSHCFNFSDVLICYCSILFVNFCALLLSGIFNQNWYRLCHYLSKVLYFLFLWKLRRSYKHTSQCCIGGCCFSNFHFNFCFFFFWFWRTVYVPSFSQHFSSMTNILLNPCSVVYKYFYLRYLYLLYRLSFIYSSPLLLKINFFHTNIPWLYFLLPIFLPVLSHLFSQLDPPSSCLSLENKKGYKGI